MRKHLPSRPGLRISRPRNMLSAIDSAGDKREVLIDGLDAGVPRLHRRLEVHRLALERDLAVVGDHGAGNRLDERRFAGAVVADDGEDFARIEIEIGMVEGGDTAIALDEAARCRGWVRCGISLLPF